MTNPHIRFYIVCPFCGECLSSAPDQSDPTLPHVFHLCSIEGGRCEKTGYMITDALPSAQYGLQYTTGMLYYHLTGHDWNLEKHPDQPMYETEAKWYLLPNGWLTDDMGQALGALQKIIGAKPHLWQIVFMRLAD